MSPEQWADVITVFMRDITEPKTGYSNRKEVFNLIEKKLTTPEQWNSVVEGFFHDITKEYYSYETRKEAFDLIKDHLSAAQRAEVEPLCR